MSLGRTVISASELEARITGLAGEIDRAQGGRPLVLVGILKGSIFFLCDLAKRLSTPVTLDFLQVTSYGKGTRSSGNVRLLRDLSTDIAGQDVLIVEDIVDTGRTLQKILQILGTRSPRSIRVCSLLKKRLPDNAGIPVDFLGFEIEDEFVVGYGLDHAEMYRNLPYVAVLAGEPEEAQ